MSFTILLFGMLGLFSSTALQARGYACNVSEKGEMKHTPMDTTALIFSSETSELSSCPKTIRVRTSIKRGTHETFKILMNVGEIRTLKGDNCLYFDSAHPSHEIFCYPWG